MTAAADPLHEVDGEAVELLQTLIRNACVNDGSDASGHEGRSADVLASVLTGPGVDLETYSAVPGRTNLVARVEGSDPAAPTLALVGHTDVVPVTAAHWSRDPFGGELVDGEVWGRGAVDMLNLTATMALALRRLADRGWRPRGTLVLAAVADEEASSTHGVHWLLDHATDAVAADFVITESGGIPLPGADGTKLPVIVGEKGCIWATLRVHGAAGHASQPLRTDNALVTAAEVVRRIDAYRPETMIHDTWRRFVAGMAFPPELAGALVDPDRLAELVEVLPIGMARQAHACTHTTLAPTMLHGTTKLNVIPGVVDLDVDVRTLPGHTAEDVRAMLVDAAGDLAAKVEVVRVEGEDASLSPADTPLWGVLASVARRWYPDAALVPYFSVGATDARWYRRLGAVGYGFGLFSTELSLDDFGARFHGDDERIDVKSLGLSAAMFETVAAEFLS
ncbi:MAG: M20/M25/M40 family metallo-hydrolase [Acidimicrobiia bacterium]